MAKALQKTYTYKVYSPSGAFLGVLANVVSEFSYTQNINTVGAQLQIVLQNSFDDVGASQTSDYWLDQSSNKIIDEAGNRIVFDLNFTFANLPIAVGNHIKVYSSYADNPTGKQVFDGQISKWQLDYSQQKITLTVLSWGFQLDNLLITSDPTSSSIDQETYTSSYSVGYGGPGLVAAAPVAQSFNIATTTVINSIILFCSGSDDFYVGSDPPDHIYPTSILNWKLYGGTPTTPGSLIDSGTVNYTGSAIQQITIQFSQAQTLSGDYFLQVDNGSAGTWYYGSVKLYASTANPYAGGSVYTSADGGSTWTQVATDDLAFIVQGSSGSSTLSFVNQDPAALLRNILDQAISQGSVTSYSTASIDSAGTNVSYAYKIQTILEGIQKIVQLAPAGWYFYVDVGTNLLHFHRTPNTANHILIMGSSVNSLTMEHSLEQIINSIYFTGGPTSGINLYASQTDAASIADFGQRLERMSDNRIADLATANIIMSNELGNKSQPVFFATAGVLENVYDIETLDLGETVGLRGFGNLIDALTFQIVGLERHPNRAVLTLGTLLPRTSSEFDALKRRIDKLETVDNPASPS